MTNQTESFVSVADHWLTKSTMLHREATGEASEGEKEIASIISSRSAGRATKLLMVYNPAPSNWISSLLLRDENIQ